jgi:general secretion pathway protein M
MKLGGREKRVIALGCLVVAAFLFFQFGLSPALQRQKTLERLVTQKEREVQEVQGLRETYLARKAVVEEVHRSLNRRGQEFAIFSFLEELANKSGIKSNIMYMKPALSTAGELFRESSVEMKLEGIALQALIQYLYEIEQAPQLLRVRRLAIKPRAANPDMLDVTVQVSTFYLVEKTG